VTEKIHGACFCMLTDGERVWSAKRRGLLQADDDGDGFFHFASIVREHEDAVKNAHSLVRQHLGSSAPSMVVQVFGELFGGGYPHPDVRFDSVCVCVCVCVCEWVSESGQLLFGPELSSGHSASLAGAGRCSCATRANGHLLPSVSSILCVRYRLLVPARWQRLYVPGLYGVAADLPDHRRMWWSMVL